MNKTCNNCGTESTNISVPYAALELAEARHDRHMKRMWVLVLVLVGLLFASNLAWIIYESQFETVETWEEITIDAEQDGEGVNIVGGGDIEYGAESEDN